MTTKVKTHDAKQETSGDSEEMDRFVPIVERLLVWLVSSQDSSLIGDFLESYHDLHERYGTRYASVWFTKQLLISLPSLLRLKLQSLTSPLLDTFDNPPNSSIPSEPAQT